MSLFVTVSAIIFCLVALGGSIVGLINYTVNKAKPSRDEKISDRHDRLIQEKHFDNK